MQNTEKPVQMVWDLWRALIGQHGSRESPRCDSFVLCCGSWLVQWRVWHGAGARGVFYLLDTCCLTHTHISAITDITVIPKPPKIKQEKLSAMIRPLYLKLKTCICLISNASPMFPVTIATNYSRALTSYANIPNWYFSKQQLNVHKLSVFPNPVTYCVYTTYNILFKSN